MDLLADTIKRCARPWQWLIGSAFSYLAFDSWYGFAGVCFGIFACRFAEAWTYRKGGA